jgi:hypothetical protein
MVMVSVSGEILEHNRSRSYYFQVQAVTFCDFLGNNVENFDDAVLSGFFAAVVFELLVMSNVGVQQCIGNEQGKASKLVT